MIRMLCFSAIGTLALTGCGSRNTFAPPPPPSVTVSPPDQRDVVVYDTFPGRTEAFQTVEIRARVAGYLEQKKFVDAERVKKDQLLFVIEQEPYVAAVNAAEASLAQARAASELARSELLRKKQAFETRAVSEIDVLAAEAEYSVKTSAVLSAEAVLDQAELQLSYTEVTAPAFGRIGRDLVSVGNFVGGTSPTLLTTLVVEDPIFVYFDLDERTLLKYAPEEKRRDRVGADVPPVQMELADGSRYPKLGRIDYLDNRIDPDTGTLRARAVFPNTGGVLIPGSFARVLVPDQRANALLVPDAAIQRDLVGPYVLLVDETNTVQTAYITPGPRIEAERIIEAGLEPTDRVIVKGLQRARPGIQVEPAETPVGETSPEPPAAASPGAPNQASDSAT